MPRPLAILAVILLVLVACEAESGSGPRDTPEGSLAGGTDGSPAPTGSDAPTGSAAPTGGGASGEVVEITVSTDTGTELRFEPAEVTVPAGVTVRLTFVNQSTLPHNLTVDDPIGAATATMVDPGAEETIEFTAPEAGEYTFVCTLHPGMEGTLVVEGG